MLQPNASEESDQILLVNWVRRTYPELAETLHHSPNGGYRHKATASRMRLMGTSPGFPDMVFYLPPGLAIELKSRGGHVRPNQLEWLDRLKRMGFVTAVCYGIEDAQQTIREYMA